MDYNNILKILEEDDDETMHSAADVEALMAELKREIQGNTSSRQQPADSTADTVGVQPYGDQTINPIVLDHEAKLEKELEMKKFQNTSHRQSIAVGSNVQHPLPLDFNADQTRISQEFVRTSKYDKQVPISILLPMIQPQLDKVSAMQLQTLLLKRKKNEISKDDFVQHFRSIAGEQMIKTAATKLQTQSVNNAAKPRELEREADSHGAQLGQKSTSSLAASSAHDSQMRQAPPHPNLTVNHFRPTSQPMNATNMSAVDPKKIPAESLTHMNRNGVLQQDQVQWPSPTSKEQKTSISSSMTHVKQEPSDQSNKQQRAQLSASHGLSSGYLKDESLVIQPSTAGHTPLASSSSVLVETSILSSGRIPFVTAPVYPKKPLIGQTKLMQPPGSSPLSSKKQKVFGSFVDQSIEHLNDVTAVSGINLREEEELLLSGSKEDTRVSEASRRVVQEEEERLILQKIPLQRKMVDIMAKSGLKNMSKDVERCLCLCVEQRMHGLIFNAIRLSKQRVDFANLQPESGTGIDADKEKDDSHGKSTKVNKEEDDKTRATAANVAARAATGAGDITSRWQLMIESKQKSDKDVGRKARAISTRNTRENQDHSIPSSVRKVGRKQVVARRSISVKDVIGVLEREPQMSTSTLLCRFYQKLQSSNVGKRCQ